MIDRGIAPIVATACLLVIVVAIGAVAGGAIMGIGSQAVTATPQQAVITADANAETNEIALRHEQGAPLDVDRLQVRVFVDGQPLAEQPPVPFFSATGFHSGPEGPFNPAADQRWSVGERASLQVAQTTNSPSITPGAQITVELYHDSQQLTTVTVRAS